jgi:hypothetical protein
MAETKLVETYDSISVTLHGYAPATLAEVLNSPEFRQFAAENRVDISIDRDVQRDATFIYPPRLKAGKISTTIKANNFAAIRHVLDEFGVVLH